MIDSLLVFKTSGLLLHKKYYSNKQIGQDEELISGFFSALFSFLEQLNQFGLIEKIQTTDRIILINKVQNIYVGLIISRFTINDIIKGKFNIRGEIWNANKQLEELGENLIHGIANIIVRHSFKSHILGDDTCITPHLLSKVENQIDKLVEINNSKLKIIRDVLYSHKDSNKIIKMRKKETKELVNI